MNRHSSSRRTRPAGSGIQPLRRKQPASGRRPRFAPAPRARLIRRRDLLTQALSAATLAAAWSRVRRNGGVAGGDNVTCAAFERNARVRLVRLRRSLWSGSYAPGPVRRVEVMKETGGTRPLAIPCVADRIVQTAVAFTLAPVVEPAMSPASFGYRPGLGVQDAVTRVIELRRREKRGWVLESDVARFFETVPHAPLLDLIEARTGDARVTELIAVWLEASATGGQGLLQGSPLSPLLANLYLDEVDHLLDTPEARLVRYADDFVVLARRRADAKLARQRAAGLMRERGLALHPEKTHLRGFGDGFWFLGYYFIRNLALRDLKHTPEAAPPVWDLDAPPREAVVSTTQQVAPAKRPELANLSETMRARLRRARRRSSP